MTLAKLAIILTSLLLAAAAGAGMAWTIRQQQTFTVDGLFLLLILATMGGIFLLNALWEMKALFTSKPESAPAPASKTVKA